MKTTAAILTQTGKPLEIVELEIPKLCKGQVLIKVKYSGICGTQIMEINGLKGEDKWLPHCLGHEAVGEVVECGPSVTKVTVGDRVVLSWLKGSGIDASGTKYQWGTREVNAGPVTTFQQISVISENLLSKIKTGKFSPIQVFLGCAALTGMGAVKHVLRASSGDSLIIFGAGGVGLSALMMARDIGLKPIIMVDTSSERLGWAAKLGATILVNPKVESLSSVLNSHSIISVDHVVEATGSGLVIENMLDYVKSKSGQSVVISNIPDGQNIKISPSHFNMGKSILGTWGGNSNPDFDIDIYDKIINKNASILSELTKSKYQLKEINQAIRDMALRTVPRPIIVME